MTGEAPSLFDISKGDSSSHGILCPACVETPAYPGKVINVLRPDRSGALKCPTCGWYAHGSAWTPAPPPAAAQPLESTQCVACGVLVPAGYAQKGRCQMCYSTGYRSPDCPPTELEDAILHNGKAESHLASVIRMAEEHKAAYGTAAPSPESQSRNAIGVCGECRKIRVVDLATSICAACAPPEASRQN